MHVYVYVHMCGMYKEVCTLYHTHADFFFRYRSVTEPSNWMIPFQFIFPLEIMHSFAKCFQMSWMNIQKKKDNQHGNLDQLNQ